MIGSRLNLSLLIFSDPSSIVEFSDILYNNLDFATSIYNALTPKGILTIQIGEADEVGELPDSIMINDQVLSLVNHLGEVGFQSVVWYSEEMHGRFSEPWAYVSVFKDFSTRADWFTNEAKVNLKMRRRSVPTITGESPFRVFDGATMMSYKFAHTVEEVMFCSREPQPEVCRAHKLADQTENVLLPSMLDLVEGPNGRQRLVAKERVEAGSVLSSLECVESLYAGPDTLEVVSKMAAQNSTPYLPMLNKDFLGGLGWTVSSYVSEPGGMIATLHNITHRICSFFTQGKESVGVSVSGILGALEQNCRLPEVQDKVGLDARREVPNRFFDHVDNTYMDRRFPPWECTRLVLQRTIDAGNEVTCLDFHL